MLVKINQAIDIPSAILNSAPKIAQKALTELVQVKHKFRIKISCGFTRNKYTEFLREVY